MIEGVRAWRELSTTVGIVLSLGIHVMLALWIWALPPAAQTAQQWFEMELIENAGTPSDQIGGNATDARSVATPTEPGMAAAAQNVDAFDPGERGDMVGATDARELASRADVLTLQDTLPVNVRRMQAQRLRTARDRATREPRRATPHVGELVFVTTGDGARFDRVHNARTDAQPGTMQGAVAFTPGADRNVSNERSPNADTTVIDESSQRGRRSEALALGLPDARGERAQRAAPLATARPPVDEGAANTESTWQSPRVRDNHEAMLLAAQMMESLVDTSTQRGRVAGRGAGGVGGGGAPGSGGGNERGGRSHAYAPGNGNDGNADMDSPIFRRWYLTQRRRIEDGVVFPRERAFGLDQGESLYRIVVRRNGTLARAPELRRSSGFRDFDAAARQAIEQAIPLAPLPAEIAPGAPEVAILVPIRFHNPLFR